MRIMFRRDVQHRYVVVAAPDREELDYKAKMILYNRIEGLAACFVEQLNAERLFYYDIPEGMISLADHLEKNAADEKLYRSLFAGIARILRQMREYLLDEGELLLTPETVFLSTDSGETLFVYFPLEAEPMEKKCIAFSEFLLRRIDHEERAAVELGYAFYRNCVKGRISADMLYDLAQQKTDAALESAYPEWGGKNTGDTGTAEEADLLKEKEGTLSFLFDESSTERKKKGKRAGLRRFFARKKDSPGKEEDREKGGASEKRKKRTVTSEIPEQGDAIREPEPAAGEAELYTDHREAVWPEDTGGASFYETVLLKTAEKENEKTRAWLIPQENFAGENLYLEEDSYLVGKGIAGADLILDSPAVSRIHAKFLWQEENYFLSDLGSRNGTQVNGETLAPGKPVKLAQGDEIRFADKIFLYYNKK